jgi:hypothetical protein
MEIIKIVRVGLEGISPVYKITCKKTFTSNPSQSFDPSSLKTFVLITTNSASSSAKVIIEHVL